MNLWIFMTTLLLGSPTTIIYGRIQERAFESLPAYERPQVSEVPRFLEEWQQYKTTFNKFYRNGDEDHRRMNIFIENCKFIEDHNRLFINGLSSFELGHNDYSDLTHQEFLEQYTTYSKSPIYPEENDEPTVKSDPTVRMDDKPEILYYEPKHNYIPRVPSNQLNLNNDESIGRYNLRDSSKKMYKRSLPNENYPDYDISSENNLSSPDNKQEVNVKEPECKASWLYCMLKSILLSLNSTEITEPVALKGKYQSKVRNHLPQTYRYEYARNEPTVQDEPTVRNEPTLLNDPTPTVRTSTPIPYESYGRVKESYRKSFDDYIEYLPQQNIYVPPYIDWRSKGGVTPVKHQGDCKASWLFSTTGTLEGQVYQKTRNLTSLSEQNILDCSNFYGNKGCSNGTVITSFKYILENGGIDTNTTYPWSGKQSWFCYYRNYPSNPTIKKVVLLQSRNETALQIAVASIGPISVKIDASSRKFQFYRNGIYNEPNCSSTNLNYYLLVVGYGRNFWIVKNSMGIKWGRHGYIFMLRNQNNQCGIATSAMFPLIN